MAMLSVDDVNQRLRGVPGPPPPKPERGELSIADVNARLSAPMGRVKSALHAAGQGAVDVLADLPMAYAISRQSGGRNFIEQLDRIDRGERPQYGKIFGATSTLLEYANAKPERRAEIRAKYEHLGLSPQETGPYKFGESAQAAVREALPTNPDYQGEFFADQLPRGIGSTAGFFAGGVTGRLVKLPALVGDESSGLGIPQPFWAARKSGPTRSGCA